MGVLVVVVHPCGRNKVAPWKGQSCSSCQQGSRHSRCSFSLKVMAVLVVALEVWVVLVVALEVWVVLVVALEAWVVLEVRGWSTCRRFLLPMQAD